LARQYNFSRRFTKELIHTGKITLEGTKIIKDIEAAGDKNYKIDINFPDITYDLSEFLIQNGNGILFLYKPPFIHTERQTPLDTLCLDDVIKGSFQGYRLISRLDYGVDGIVSALNETVNAEYGQKNYYAWVYGDFPDECTGMWSIDACKRRKVAVKETEKGKKIYFRCLKRSNGKSLVDVTLESAGRHQIRAVCAYIGYPIVGDHLYGSNGKETEDELLPQRIMLHCYKVTINGVSAESPYKDAFVQIL
jgi:16S rRNA U516 pseudouridylate synthase RsuA-like enzyme